MAHTIQIPVSFEFRKMRVRWRERESRIVGLSWDPTGSSWGLKAIATGRGRKAVAELSIDDVASRLWMQCSDAVDSFRNQEDWDNADRTIERICADFQPQLLVASPEDDDEEHSLPADAWQLRDDFLRVPSEVSNVLAFLNRWGRWNYQGYTQLHQFVRFQQRIRRALVSLPHQWFSNDDGFPDLGLDLDFERKSVYPYFAFDTFDCESVITRTVTIDLLRQVKFKTCARQDCGQPFPIESKHKRKFCCWYCGHLESVRRGRARSR